MAHPWSDLPNGEGKISGIKANALLLATPDEAIASHKISGRQRSWSGSPHSHSGISIVSLLRVVGIETDRDQDHSRPPGVRLPYNST